MAIKKISSGASRLIRYQRSDTRHRKLRRARSHTPAFPVTRAVTMKAGAADPRTFSNIPCGVAPPGRSLGSVSPLGTKTRDVVVAYTKTKNVAIGCLMIHDLSGETSEAPTSAAGSAMIGTPLDSGHHEPAAPDRPKPAPGRSRSPAIGRRHQLREDVGSMVADG
ncbi:MAG TPA: hypothetical protein VFB83_04540 [Propionibacteriaceae bacterium]|nr:hypothetical protein [Propionibacteriaceae bacterium]